MPAEVARNSSWRMAEQRVGGGVPELSEMSVQELRRRLQLVEEALSEVCRVCNRRVSKRSEMDMHNSGTKHNAVLDARAHRMTHHQLGMQFFESLWCDVCGKLSPHEEGYRAHLLGKGHRECKRVETQIWSMMLSARKLREELNRRGVAVASSCSAGPETKASGSSAPPVLQTAAGTAAAPCLPGFVRASSTPTGASAALGAANDWEPVAVGCPMTHAEAAAGAAATATLTSGRNTPVPVGASDDEDGDDSVVAVAIAERLEGVESSVAGLVGGVLDVGRDIRELRSEQKETKQVVLQLSAATVGLAGELKSLRELLSGVPGELVALTEAVERPVSLQLRRDAR